ncbi:uncharacterized protein LOC126353854 isoform X2 [Schistocerca gregaria]|uniref:uncharacterized protein LOC126353854 isoform X2 n=1 Tax=Schistocerca gregaria TaxID=7010 RepID=UPI00211EACDB|nr:uncharacterized protein LOC126353854 isoform X2 [Schistocerca gregaria]
MITKKRTLAESSNSRSPWFAFSMGISGSKEKNGAKRRPMDVEVEDRKHWQQQVEQKEQQLQQNHLQEQQQKDQQEQPPQKQYQHTQPHQQSSPHQQSLYHHQQPSPYQQSPYHHQQPSPHQQSPYHHQQPSPHQQSPYHHQQPSPHQQSPYHQQQPSPHQQSPYHQQPPSPHQQSPYHQQQPSPHQQSPYHHQQPSPHQKSPYLQQAASPHPQSPLNHQQLPPHHQAAQHHQQPSEIHQQPSQHHQQLSPLQQTPQHHQQPSPISQQAPQHHQQPSTLQQRQEPSPLNQQDTQDHKLPSPLQQTPQNRRQPSPLQKQSLQYHQQPSPYHQQSSHHQQSSPYHQLPSPYHHQPSPYQQQPSQHHEQSSPNTQEAHQQHHKSPPQDHQQSSPQQQQLQPQKPPPSPHQQLPLQHHHQQASQLHQQTPQEVSQKKQQQQQENHCDTQQGQTEQGEKQSPPVEVKTEVVDDEPEEIEEEIEDVEDVEDVDDEEELVEDEEEAIAEDEDDEEAESLGESIAQLSEEYFTDDASDYGASPMPKIPNGIPGKVFHDCVHGSMWLHPLCVKLVDTLEFQRLRNIKQLGLAYLVYPGAGHNRFEHSLGVCYLASRMLEALEQNSTNTSNERLVTEEEALCVQIAGLCHDLGHGPFSHTWEHFVSDYDPTWKHETSTLEIFDELANRFDEDFKMFGLDSPKKKLIKELIKGEPLNEGEPMSLSADKYFIYEIISNKTNDIDVDKWEYLARDAAQLGVPVAFQSKRLFEFCRVGFVEGDERAHIIIRDKEAITVFAMFQARSELHYFAYQHRVVLSLEEMLLDAFREADRVGYTHNGYKLSEIHKDARAFVTLNDSIFYNLLYSHDEYLETSRRLLADICERKIYEFVCLKHITPTEVAELMQSIRNQTKDESEIQRLLLKSLVSNAKEMIRKTGLLTDVQVESLIYKKIEMKVRHAPERDALDTVYVYSKYTPEKGTALRNWKNVPIYPIDVEKLCHVDILILTRTKLSDTVLKKLRELSDHRVF